MRRNVVSTVPRRATRRREEDKMNSAHSESGDASIHPISRIGRPAGIDWTSAAPECAVCWRRWLAADTPASRLLSRRTQAALAAAAVTISATTPAIDVAAGSHLGG